jgi:serine/threonine-protein phosphatase 2A regulatory subunit B
MTTNTLNENSVNQTSKKETLNILEWRFNQFLGEKMRTEELCEEENQSYVISDMKMTDNSNYVIIGDKGGRIIIFRREYRGPTSNGNSTNKLSYFYEYNAFDKDFDVHKSTEYSEVVRSLDVLPTIYNDKIDVLSCGYRTIKLHRVYNTKIKQFCYRDGQEENDCDNIKGNSNGFLRIPKLKSTKFEVKTKSRAQFTLQNCTELNNVSLNRITPNIFITSNESKAYLFDIEHTNDCYEIFDINNSPTTEDHESEDGYTEGITLAKFNDKCPNMFAVGTSFGNVKLCDIRTTSDYTNCNLNYLDEFNNIIKGGMNLSKTLFSYQIMAVHDIEFISEYSFATRHYLSVNVWDSRMPTNPTNRFLVYEPIIPRLSQLYKKNYLQSDKFKISISGDKNFVLTGSYNNMFHVFDINQRLNTQCTIDDSSEKALNTNIIRKINSKGSCFYKKDDPYYNQMDYGTKIMKHCYSPTENWIVLACQNCLYSYSGTMLVKETKPKI